MRKSIKVSLCLLTVGATLSVGYGIGVKQGENSVIDNQIIMGENQARGNYTSVYKGQNYTYWYESKVGTVASQTDNNILIKRGLDILFHGTNVGALKSKYVNADVLAVYECDDTENTLTIFI